MAAAATDFEQAGELKFGQVGIANLRVRTLDPARLAAEMAERVQRAPKLFAHAAVVLDFGGLSQCPGAADARALVQALREAGVHPVALAYGTSAIEALAHELGLPLLSKFRAAYERGDDSDTRKPVERRPEPVETELAQPATTVSATPAAARLAEPGLLHPHTVRSGQQVYAQDRDLTVCASVGAGAEVIADGSIHVYGALRGRALAGANGNDKARIFCREFHAELVAINGHYKVLEEIPPLLLGKAVQVRLEGERIVIEELA